MKKAIKEKIFHLRTTEEAFNIIKKMAEKDKTSMVEILMEAMSILYFDKILESDIDKQTSELKTLVKSKFLNVSAVDNKINELMFKYQTLINKHTNIQIIHNKFMKAVSILRENIQDII